MKTLLVTFALAFSLAAATVDGIKIHSSSAGKGPKTIILVHGWTCDETTWSEQVPVLSKTYRVLTLDLPGHGKTGSPADGKLSMSLFARALEAVRAEAKADHVVLVGHSMGTPVIVQYARLYPQHVAAMVFVDGLVSLGNGKGPAPDPKAMSGPDGKKNREAMIRGMFSASTTPANQTKILDMMLAAPESTAVGAMNATFDPAIWKGDVLNTPILGIYADKSALNNPPYIKEHFPNFEYHEVAGTGHFVMLDNPAEFNKLLLEFLDRQQLLSLLHIQKLRPGADGKNPNYDEAKANPYPNLPDPLVLKNGQRVTSAKMWWDNRRPEIVEDFDREVYGRVPKNTPNVKWEVASRTREMSGDVSVITKQLIGHADHSQDRTHVDHSGECARAGAGNHGVDVSISSGASSAAIFRSNLATTSACEGLGLCESDSDQRAARQRARAHGRNHRIVKSRRASQIGRLGCAARLGLGRESSARLS